MLKLLSRLFSKHKVETTPIQDYSGEIDQAKAQAHKVTESVKQQSVARSEKAAESFDKTKKSVYDVAEKIYLATGQRF